MKQGLLKRERFAPRVIDVLDNLKFRNRLAVALRVSERSVSNWIKADNPKLVTDESVEVAMDIMGALERSDVTEWVDVEQNATANA